MLQYLSLSFLLALIGLIWYGTNYIKRTDLDKFRLDADREFLSQELQRVKSVNQTNKNRVTYLESKLEALTPSEEIIMEDRSYANCNGYLIEIGTQDGLRDYTRVRYNAIKDNLYNGLPLEDSIRDMVRDYHIIRGMDHSEAVKLVSELEEHSIGIPYWLEALYTATNELNLLFETRGFEQTYRTYEQLYYDGENTKILGQP